MLPLLYTMIHNRGNYRLFNKEFILKGSGKA